MAGPERNIRLVIAYDGTRYAGWQIQPVASTVQGVLEERLAQLTQRPCRLRAAGRTDARVHALGQVANFRCTSAIPLRGLHRGLNALLPPDVNVLSVEEVPLDFDSRRHNRGKHYRYTIWNERAPSPLHGATSLQLHRPLDLQAMAVAARSFVGTHDFSAFRAASCDRESTRRTIYRCSIGREGSLVLIDVEGTAFLRNMVRIIAGTLIEIGKGKREGESVDELLAGGDRRLAGMTAPAHGLCLVRVFL